MAPHPFLDRVVAFTPAGTIGSVYADLGSIGFVLAIVPSASGTLDVFGEKGWATLDSLGALVRTRPISFPPLPNRVERSGAGLVANGNLPRPSTFGLPFHLLTDDGAIAMSFGPNETVRPDQLPFAVERAFDIVGDSTIVFSPVNRYSVASLSVGSDDAMRYDGLDGLFQPWQPTLGQAGDELVVDLAYFDSKIWTLSIVRAGEVEPSDRGFVSLVSVIDPGSHQEVARLRYPKRFWGFLPSSDLVLLSETPRVPGARAEVFVVSLEGG